VDGTPNKAGKITEAAEFVTNHAGTKTTHVFFVADIGPDNYILGFPFLEVNERTVNWAHALVERFYNDLHSGRRRMDTTNKDIATEEADTPLGPLHPGLVTQRRSLATLCHSKEYDGATTRHRSQ